MQTKWWHGKVAYQIYPKSFKDTNGDGFGDLPGIIEKIPYLADLGIELLWISPIYKSPFADQGYDIADYQDIDPIFGSLEDFKKLKAEADKYGIGIIMDLVVNHCSDEHEWFKKASADPTCEEASYFTVKARMAKSQTTYVLALAAAYGIRFQAKIIFTTATSSIRSNQISIGSIQNFVRRSMR